MSCIKNFVYPRKNGSIGMFVFFLIALTVFIGDLHADEPVKIPPEHKDKALYEWADEATLLKERARLKALKKELKEQKKAEKARVRELKKQVKADPSLKDEKEEAKRKLQATKDELSLTKTLIKQTRNFLITPFGAPSYTPEMGFLIAAGGLLSFKTNRLDPKIQRSSITAMGGYSSTGSSMAFDNFTSFWYRDWIRFQQEGWFKNMPDNYWGVGYKAGAAHAEPNSDTEYVRTWWDISAQLTVKLGIDDLYAGLNISFNQTIADDVSDAIEADENYLEYGPNNYNGGLGVVLRYDSRDVTVTAFKGLYLSVEALFYGKYLGGDNTYQSVKLDYRQYLPFFFYGSTICWRIYSRMSFNEVPYGEMSMIGNPFDLRGYQWGRYRDKTVLFGILEYRLQIGRIKKVEGKSPLSPHGVVVWTGFGSLGETYADMTDWLPNVGVGYRLEIQPRMNVRVDWGFGNDSHAFYVNFLESF